MPTCGRVRQARRYGGAVTTPTGLPTCPRHPDRETRLACARCGRPTCADCLQEGLCPDCRAELAARHRAMPSHPAVVSTALLAVNVTVFLLGMLSATFEQWSFAYGAQQQDLVRAGQEWRLVSAAFLHAGLTHLLFNMWALYVLGVELERRIGGLPFAALYLAAAVSGGAAYQLFGGPAPVVGASGAVFGLFGAWLVAAWRARGSAAGRASLSQMLTLLAINLALPLFIPGIAWQAHLGGFAAGIVVTAAWQVGPRSQVLRGAVAAVVGVGAYVAAVPPS